MEKPKKREMHPRNIFKTPPDYTELAIKYKDFRKVCELQLSGKVSIDYKNESALRALTDTLLQEFYQLHVKFAPGSLVPTLPLRLNYILWLEDLMQVACKDALTSIKGIDIGCGSSCIYSLLAARKNAWHMLALETNETNLEYAKANVESNNLTELIKVFKTQNKSVIFKDYFETTATATENYHFCLCNPPFFDATLRNPFSGQTRKSNKRPPPNNCPTGNNEELACDGGEVEFVERIINESLELSQRICVFTSMLGHKSSLSKIIEILKGHNLNKFSTTEFIQGNTTRWGIAWTLQNIELP